MLFMGWGDGILIAQGVISIVQGLSQLSQTIFLAGLLNDIVHGTWLLDQLRKFGLYFDKMLINFSNSVYGYYQQIVGGTLITSSVIDGFMSRMYLIVGIFIFFKLAIVAMRYMINPEHFMDDKVGAESLVKRVILGSLIIIMIPLIFDKANDLQKYIIQDRLIEKVILPEETYNELVSQPATGRMLAMMVFKGFFNWNGDESTKKGQVYNAYDRVMTYDQIVSFDENLMKEKNGTQYYISYVPVISTLAVGYLLFMLIKYSMETIFRSFKLVFLQVLSPLVMVNYMLDPADNETLKKWTNATISTYLLIFIRTITLWFATLMAFFLKNGIPHAAGETSLLNDGDPLLKALIVLGLFAFLKELPKLISDIFGYNLQENETIGGIMNQGVNLAKGAAMGIAGYKIAKPMIGWSMANSTLGSLGDIAGGVGGLDKDAKRTSKRFARLTTKTANSVGSSYGTMSSMLGNQMQGLFGNTALSFVGQGISSGASSAERTHKSTPYDTDPFEPKEPQSKEGSNDTSYHLQNKNSNEIVNDMKNDTNLQAFIDGNHFNLSGALTEPNHPAIVGMSEHIYSSMGSPSEISVDKIKKDLVDAIYSDDSKITNPGMISSSDMASLIDGIRSEITSSIPSSTSSSSAQVSSSSTSAPVIGSSHSKDGLESVIREKGE